MSTDGASSTRGRSSSGFAEGLGPCCAGVTAALLHSLARDHALVDDNKRPALAATIAFLGGNGRRLTLSTDQACEFVMSVASGELSEIADIAERLVKGTEAR